MDYNAYDYINSLKADKQTLVNNLVTKGVSASNEETFTTLAPKVLNIDSGGGDPNKKVFMTDTIQAMNELTTMKEGDMCLVYNIIQAHPTSDSVLNNATFLNTVVFDSSITDYASLMYRSEDMNEELMIDLNPSQANVTYYNMNTSDNIRYTYSTTDAKTYTLEESESTTINFSSPMTLEMGAFNEQCAQLFTTTQIDFEGIYTYNDGSWNYTDIGISTDASQVIAPNKAYTNQGIITGTINGDFEHTIPIYLQDSEPEDKNGLWCTLKHSLSSFQQGKVNIFLTSNPINYTINQAEYIYTLEDELPQIECWQNNYGYGSSSSFQAIYYNDYMYDISKVDSNVKINLLTGEKTSLAGNSLISGFASNASKYFIFDGVQYIYFMYSELRVDPIVGRYDISNDSFEDITSKITMTDITMLYWAYNGKLAITYNYGNNFNIYNTSDWSVTNTGEVSSGVNNISSGTYRWLDDNTIRLVDSWGIMYQDIKADTFEVINSVPNSQVVGAMVWVNSMSCWLATSGNGSADKGILCFYNELNFNQFKPILFNAVKDNAPLAVYGTFIPNNNYILCISGRDVYRINVDTLVDVPLVRGINNNLNITLQIGDISFIDINNHMGPFENIYTNIKNCLMFNDNVYEDGDVNMINQVYIGNGSSWDLVYTNTFSIND